MKVEWFRGNGRKPWFWHIIGGQGEIVAPSQGYTTAWSARRTAKLIAKGLGVPLRKRP